MLEYTTGVQLALGFAAFIVIGWSVLSYLMKKVTYLEISSYSIITTPLIDDIQRRIVDNYPIQEDSQRIPLHYGMNDFFITVNKGVLQKWNHGDARKLDNLLRDNKAIHYVRVRVKVTGNRLIRLTKFTQTNLSAQNVRLNWRQVQPTT